MPNHANAQITKVLVANRGEIAVRVIRAAKDAGIASVAVYAEPDADAPFVKLADEAFALGGQTSAESYLVFDKILDAAAKAGADAIHPGYGFLSENADFAQAVIDAGLIWIGPSPQSIRDLGDKVTARHIAERAQAPMAAGTKDPVKNADEVVAFAKEFGVPVAIKAAFGGGGRGMKVAHTIEEIPELFESATREAIAAFGRGECFVEQYLDKARHVEAQVIADKHGNVVVAGTRDCSLQRRFQKLVEEAPAPFLSDEVRSKIHESAKRICKEAGYYGAGTVVPGLLADPLRGLVDLGAHLVGQERRGRLLDQLLKAALQRAVTGAGDDHVAVLVRDDLRLDVAGLVQVLLHEALAATEGGDGLTSGGLEQLGNLLDGVRDLHAATATTEGGLDGHRNAELLGERHDLVGVLDRVLGARGHRRLSALGDVAGGDLVTQVADRLRRGTDPDQPGVDHGLREIGVLGEEAVAGVDRVRAGLGGGVEDLVEHQVRLGRGLTAQGEGLVGELDERRIGVRFGVYGHTGDTGVLGGPDHAHGDLASVGYEDLCDLRVGMVGH